MAYRSRRRFRRRTGYRRRPTRTYRNKKLVDGRDSTPKFMKILRSGASVAAAVPAIAKTVSGIVSMINTEKKFIDNTQTSPIANGTPLWYFTSNIAQGTDYTQRIGRSIRATDLTVRLNFNLNPSGALQEIFRYMIVCDKEYDVNDAETTTQILGKLLADPTQMWISPLNRDYTDRFVLLKEGYIGLNQGSREIAIKKVFLRPSFHIRYNGTTAADQNNNSIFVFVFSDNNAAMNLSTVTYYARLNFTDT